jgi:hypothetical protein
MTRLAAAVGELKPMLRGRTADPALHRAGDRIVRNGTKILMTHDNIAAVAAKYGIDIGDARLVIDKVRGGTGPGRQGIYLSRVGIPADAAMLPFDAPEEAHDAAVPPDIKILPPDPLTQ